jgi:hypothetical protein
MRPQPPLRQACRQSVGHASGRCAWPHLVHCVAVLDQVLGKTGRLVPARLHAPSGVSRGDSGLWGRDRGPCGEALQPPARQFLPPPHPNAHCATDAVDDTAAMRGGAGAAGGVHGLVRGGGGVGGRRRPVPAVREAVAHRDGGARQL